MKGSRFSNAYTHFNELYLQTEDETLKFNILLKLIWMKFIHTKNLDHAFVLPKGANLTPSDPL